MKKMPSKVQIIKEIRAAQEQDPGPKAGERLFDERSLAFQQVFVDRGPAPAIEADRTMAEYFANWWVGAEYRERGTALRAALKAVRKSELEGAVDEVTEDVGDEMAPTIGSDGEMVPSIVEPAEVEELTPAQQAEIADVEAAYQLAHEVEIGDTLPPRKLKAERVREELRLLELFLVASQESPTRRVARRIADLKRAVAKMA